MWRSQLNLDIDKIRSDVLEFCSSVSSSERSNVGGFQGDDYYNEMLFQEIGNYIPRLENKPLSSYTIHSWANINKEKHYNTRHTHLNTNIFLCGIYYVKTPKDSGNIRFYDPRGAMMKEMTDHKYFYDGSIYNYIVPEENMLLFFPSWLEHDVEENNSGEERISIAFNIFVE